MDQAAIALRSQAAARAQEYATKYSRQIASGRSALGLSSVGLVACSLLGAAYHVAFVGSAFAAASLLSNLVGPSVRGKRHSPILPSAKWVVQQGKEASLEAIEREVANLERYKWMLARLVELVLRESTFDDSESRVARRITVAFFLLGYVPMECSIQDRTLVFSDGDEKILVRFRHRDGASVNVTIPQKLAALMRFSGVKRGYLFCSPGLSGNAEAFASAHNIRAYSIEAMNAWIDDTLSAGYAGPEGDVLAHLDSLERFLSRLTRALPAGTHAPSHRRAAKRWR